MMFTIYTSNLPVGAAGCANGPVIRIRPEYVGDKGLHAHEELHVKQWYFWVIIGALYALVLYSTGSSYWSYVVISGCGMHPLLYVSISKYRLWCEVQAYREQARYYPTNRNALFAQKIATDYNLSVTKDEALKLLEAA